MSNQTTAPYRVGDPVSVLFYGNGTCLGTSTVRSITRNLEGGWQITYDNLAGGEPSVTVVDDRGRDRHGYVCKKVAW